MEELKATIRLLDTACLLDCITQIGGATGADITTEARMVRAAMIDIYIERLGPEAGEALMDTLGM